MSVEEKLGVVIGRLEGLIGDIARLNGDLKRHIKDHRQGTMWVWPLGVSVITLGVLIYMAFKGS